MPAAPPLPPRPPRRTGFIVAAAAMLIIVIGAAIVFMGNDDRDQQVRTATPQPTAAPEATPSPTVEEATATPVDISAWAGAYEWTEFVAGDPGSNQTLGHWLYLEGPEGATALTGTLTQLGWQTDTSLSVRATGVGDVVEVTVVSIERGGTGTQTGDVVFRFTGDPRSPTTTVATLATLGLDVAPGVLFTPASPPPLSLTPDGLLLTDIKTGSATPLTFGAPETTVVDTIRSVLGEPASHGPGTPDCPNGQDAVAVWPDDLMLEFDAGTFLAWSARPATELTSLTGVGIGTSRTELDAVLDVEVFDSTLGVEFFTPDPPGGFGGILSSDGPDGVVEILWAGPICAFR